MTVSGERIPPATVQRSGGATADGRTPLGTRDPKCIDFRVVGERVAVCPGPGFLSRRSYRVAIELHGQWYRFAPTSGTTSGLRRDGATIATATAGQGGSVSVRWQMEPRAVEASLLYALASAFGVGGPGGLRTAIGKGIVSS